MYICIYNSFNKGQASAKILQMKKKKLRCYVKDSVFISQKIFPFQERFPLTKIFAKCFDTYSIFEWHCKLHQIILLLQYSQNVISVVIIVLLQYRFNAPNTGILANDFFKVILFKEFKREKYLKIRILQYFFNSKLKLVEIFCFTIC